MSFYGDASMRPPRVSFTNLRTGETYEMPFTPETFTERVAVNYNRQAIVGMSHETLQYSHTSNHTFPGLDFFFRATTPEEVDLIHEGRLFLFSLGYASAGADSIREGAPPRILFFWPQVVSMTCVLTNIEISHEKFNVEGRTTVFRARMDVEEARDVRLSFEEARARGTQRSPVAPEETGGGSGNAAS